VTGIYLFFAAVGVPLALWFVLSGGDEGADSGEGGAGDDGLGGIMARLLPLSTVAIAAAVFGVTGLLLGAVDTATATTFALAVAMAAGAAALNTTVFSYLRRSDSTADVDDEQLAGTIGRVVLPMTAEQRGRVVVSVGGQQRYLSARATPGATGILDVGAPVLVVSLEAGVAFVARLDPELT
jgi:membrane protein implicated in regulation of membrane protease activity